MDSKSSGWFGGGLPYTSTDTSGSASDAAPPRTPGITSPYLNFDPAFIGKATEPEFIFPEGASKQRGRFELAFSQIGSSVFLAMPGEEDSAIATAWFIMDIFSAVFHVAGFILSVAVILLIGMDRLIKTTTTRLILVYLLVFVVTGIPTLPINLLQRFNPTFTLGQHGCRFMSFLNGFVWPTQGLLVLCIATFSFIEGKATNRGRDNQATVKLLVTLAVVGVFSLSFAIVDAVYAVEFEFENKIFCYQEYDLFYTIFIRLGMNLLCIILPTLVSVILVIVGRCTRGGNSPNQVAANVVVITYFLLWLPSSVTEVSLGHFGIWASLVTVPLAYAKFLLTPILLLVVPTPYNQALRKRVCKRHEDDVGDYPETKDSKVELDLRAVHK